MRFAYEIPFAVVGLGKMAIFKSLIGSFYLLVLSYVLLNIDL